MTGTLAKSEYGYTHHFDGGKMPPAAAWLMHQCFGLMHDQLDFGDSNYDEVYTGYTPGWLGALSHEESTRLNMNAFLCVCNGQNPNRGNAANFCFDAAITAALFVGLEIKLELYASTDDCSEWESPTWDEAACLLGMALADLTGVSWRRLLAKIARGSLTVESLEPYLEGVFYDSDWEYDDIWEPGREMWNDALESSIPISVGIQAMATSDDATLEDVCANPNEVRSFWKLCFAKYRPPVQPKQAEVNVDEWETEREKTLVEVRPPTREERPGIVYFITDGKGRYKIGKTTRGNERSRLQYYQTAHPGPLTCEFVIEAKTPRFLEQQMHCRFWQKHIRGEWFQLEPDDIATLRQEFNGRVKTI